MDAPKYRISISVSRNFRSFDRRKNGRRPGVDPNYGSFVADACGFPECVAGVHAPASKGEPTNGAV